jgi:hypothetical protein
LQRDSTRLFSKLLRIVLKCLRLRWASNRMMPLLQELLDGADMEKTFKNIIQILMSLNLYSFNQS